MLKVECESCQAPYQIDERRVPPTGLKMRCPKCGHSFLVHAPGAGDTIVGGSPAEPTMSGAAKVAAEAPKPQGRAAVSRTLAFADLPSALSELGPLDKPAPPPKEAPPPKPKQPQKTLVFGDLDIDLPAKAEPRAPAGRPGDAQLAQPSLAPEPPAFSDETEGDLPAVFSGEARTVAEDPPAFDDMPAVPTPNRPKSTTERRPAAAFGDIGDDLPAVARAPVASMSDLPSPAARRTSAMLDLPAPSAARVPSDLPIPKPATKRTLSFGELDLPAAAAPGLPAVARGNLPAPAAGLPSPAGNLPATLPNLPSPLATGRQLPATQSFGQQAPLRAERDSLGDFGEISLPTQADSASLIPAASPHDGMFAAFDGLSGALGGPQSVDIPPRSIPAADTSLPRREPSAMSGPFGEVGPYGNAADREAPAAVDTAHFGELDLGPVSSAGGGASRGDVPPPPMSSGVQFGEIDLGPPPSTAAPSFSSEARPSSFGQASLPPGAPDEVPGSNATDYEASLPTGTYVPPPTAEVAKPKRSGAWKRVALALAGVSIVGGALLQLTPAGAYAHLAIYDAAKKRTFEAATRAAVDETRAKFARDSYPEARNALDIATRAKNQHPRAKQLAAYAAFVEYYVAMRFGADEARMAKASKYLEEIRPGVDVQYLQFARAMQAAATGPVDKASQALLAASKRDPSDPLSLEIAVARGEIEFRKGNPAGAREVLAEAQKRHPDDIRVTYGLARAASLLGETELARTLVASALAKEPTHVGSLLLAATMAPEAEALTKLKEILAPKAIDSASPTELVQAYVALGFLQLGRSAISDARSAFDAALKLEPRNSQALLGQGEVLFREARYTDALSRFDAARQASPRDVGTHIAVVRARLALERPADAKADLTKAIADFPKDPILRAWLGKVETQLGNRAAADKEMREAQKLVDPKHPNAVVPYVFLASFLAAQGKANEAEAVLKEAREKLPDSADLQRALGDLAEAQEKYSDAERHFALSSAKDGGRDISTRFRRAIALRKLRKFDLAGAELDLVEAKEKDYPGLSVERGLLFEDQGNLERAIELFKAALAKAPNDTDLQLRIGSAFVLVGKYDEAAPLLKKVLDKRPSAEAHHYLGRAIWGEKGPNDPEALRHLKRAVELDASQVAYHIYVAWIALDMESSQLLPLAAEEIAKAVALDANNADALWLRAELRRRQTQVEDALIDAKKALELKPTRYELHATIARCFEDKNDNATATLAWSRAVDLMGDKARPYWRYRYGKLLLDRGNAPEAAKQLLTAHGKLANAEPKPPWFVDLSLLSGHAAMRVGKKKEAITFFQQFLELSPPNSPYRGEALAALNQLGAPPPR